MNDAPEWVQVADFAAQYEAELTIDRLEAAGIPVLVKGPETGIFGPGMAGATPLGVRLYVPAAEAERARALL